MTSLGQIPLRLVSQAASRRNITFVLRDGDVPEAMNRLHDAFVRSPDVEASRSCANPVSGRRTARWGALVAQLARPSTAARSPASSIPSRPHTPVRSTTRGGPDVDVAIDFTAPDAVVTNVPALARRGINVVLGTTGWQAHEAALRAAIAEAGTGIVAAPNFSTGVVLFEAIVARGGTAVRGGRADFGALLHEAHHAHEEGRAVRNGAVS